MILNLVSLFQIGISIGILKKQCTPLFTNSENSSLVIGVSSSVLVYNTAFLFIFLVKLFVLHCWLVTKNLTFYEYIRDKYANYPGTHPFHKYFAIFISFFRTTKCNNIIFNLCKRVPHPHLNLGKYLNSDVYGKLIQITN
jgi:hypothetical protein